MEEENLTYISKPYNSYFIGQMNHLVILSKCGLSFVYLDGAFLTCSLVMSMQRSYKDQRGKMVDRPVFVCHVLTLLNLRLKSYILSTAWGESYH